MRRRHGVLLVALVIACAVLVMGYRALESDADPAIEYPRNGKANHHPKHAIDPLE